MMPHHEGSAYWPARNRHPGGIGPSTRGIWRGGVGSPYALCSSAIDDVSNALSKNGLCTPFPDAMCVENVLPSNLPPKK
jgi:hypothetical protein